MTRTLRAFFLGCQVREKLLVVGFLVIAVLMWFSGFSKRASTFWREQRLTTRELADQAQWIANSGSIDLAAQKAANRLDAAKTLDGTRLYEAMQKMAADAGIRNFTIQPPGVSPGNGQFAIHPLDFNAQLNEPDTDGSKNWANLEKFYRALEQRSPYIGIEQVTLVPNSANAAQLRLQLRVSSVEITKTR